MGTKLDIDYDQILNSVLDWISTKGLTIAVVFLIAEVANHFTKKIISRAVDRLLAKRHYPTEQDRRQRARTLKGMFSAGARIGIWAVAIFIIMVQLGANIGAIVAGAGFLGLAFGIGAQSLIKDVLTGIFIIIENQYRVGDIVELNGQGGQVVDITMRITQLRDLDGNAHFIPNGEIKHSINKSLGYSKINLTIGVAYDTDVDKVEKVINDTGLDLMKDSKFNKLIEEQPKFARVDSFDGLGLNIKVFGKVKPGKQWEVAGEFRRRLKKAFEKSKIDVTYSEIVAHNKKR